MPAKKKEIHKSKATELAEDKLDKVKGGASFTGNTASGTEALDSLVKVGYDLKANKKV